MSEECQVLECCSWVHSLDRVPTLTAREHEVFRLLHLGNSNQALADHLIITERTVRAHLTSIGSKLGIRSRLHLCLASYAYQHEPSNASVG